MLPLALLSCLLLLQPCGSSTVFTSGEGGYECIKIPALLQLHSGVLLAFGEGRRQNCSDWSWTELVSKRSLDGGGSWGPLALVYANLTAGRRHAPPIVIGNAAPVQLASGRVLLVFCKNNYDVFLGYSDDEGATFSAPRLLPSAVQPEWTWVGSGPPSSLLLASGRVLTPLYHSSTPNDDGDWSSAHALLSDDSGESWRLGGGWDAFPHFPNENQVVQLPSGLLLCNARGLLTSRVWATSSDSGDTWAPQGVAQGLVQPEGGCQGSTALHPGSGALYYSGPADSSLLRYNLSLFSSTDQGSSWAALQVIDPQPSAYSALVALGNGSMAVLYERSNHTRIIFEPQEVVFRVLG